MVEYAIIDGDILAFKSSSAVQKDIDWGDDLWTCHADLKEAWDYFQDMLAGIMSNLKKHGVHPNKMILCFSGSNNFRHTLNQDYKSNRRGSRKPCCYRGLVDKIKSNYPTESQDNLEADDMVGILATSPKYKGKCVTISSDKDFKTIPAMFYNFNTDELLNISKDNADYWLCYQTLIGDITDGYKGCPSYGPVKADRLLKKIPYGERWEAVVKAYESQGLTKEDAILQCSMAHILHYEDHKEYETKAFIPKLYVPVNNKNNSNTDTSTK